jgi:rubrerythrin
MCHDNTTVEPIYRLSYGKGNARCRQPANSTIVETGMFSIKEIFDMAIMLEKNGEATYRSVARNLSDPSLISLLEWIADEEVRHAEWFSNRQKMTALAPSNPVVDEMGRELFNDLLNGRSFSLDDVDFGRIDHVNAMVDTFIEFEKDTILFYQMLEAFLKDEQPLQELKKIICEEERHVESLQAFVDSGKIIEAGGL